MKFLYLYFCVFLLFNQGCRQTSKHQNTPALPADTTYTTYTNPLLTFGADPYAIYHEGTYYYTHTLFNCIALWKITDLTDLKHAYRKTVWLPDDLRNGSNLWTPELHRLNGKWYIYYTADGIREGSHQLYVLENSHPDPLKGKFVYKSQLHTSDDQSWAVDPSVFVLRDSIYIVWFGVPSSPLPSVNTCIYIARMENPWTISGKPVMIAIPDQPWEWKDLRNHFAIDSPQPLKSPDGRLIHIVYSANGPYPPYSALGILTARTDSDLLNPLSWKKAREPQFFESDSNRIYSPEHCCFIPSPDGKEDYILYHARYQKGPVSNDIRTPRLQKFTWDTAGYPQFGQPVPCHVPLPKPSGTKQ